MININEFENIILEDYNLLGHVIEPMFLVNKKYGKCWFYCINCGVKVCLLANKVMFWKTNPFHYIKQYTNTSSKILDLTCEELIIKKIVE